MIFEVLSSPGHNSTISAAVSGGGGITASTKIEASRWRGAVHLLQSCEISNRKEKWGSDQEGKLHRSAELPTGTANVSTGPHFGFWCWERQPGITSTPSQKQVSYSKAGGCSASIPALNFGGEPACLRSLS